MTGTNSKNYARILFYCKQPVGFGTSLVDKSLKVSFARDFVPDFSDVKANLDSHIKNISISDNGKVVEFELLNSDYTLRKFVGEHFVGVDLVKKTPIKETKRVEPKIIIAKSPPLPKIRPVKIIVPELVRKFEPASTKVDFDESVTYAQLEEEDFSADEDAEFTEDDQELNPDILSQITFPWDKEVGAAAFVRGDFLWIVFDEYKNFDIKNILEKNQDYFSEGEQIKNRFYTITRFRLKEYLNIVAFKEEENWIVGLTEKIFESENTPDLNITNSELLGSTLLLSSKKKLQPLRLIDPEVGDEMVVLSYKTEGTGVDLIRTYPDYIMIKTAQGASLVLKSDDVKLSVVRKGVEIVGPTNRLSGNAQSALRELQERERLAKLRAERLKQKSGELALIKFNTWKLNGEKKFVSDLKDLEWEITEANWSKKGEPRLKLARFYFAHYLYVESFAVIGTIELFNKNLAKTNDFLSLKAATLYSMRRYDAAAEIYGNLDYSKFTERDRKEAKFWQAATNVQLSSIVKTDTFMTDNPLDDKKKAEEKDDGTDVVANTKLMRDTSTRLLRIIRKMDPDFVNADELQKLEATARFVTNHYQEAIRRFEETDLFRSGDAFEAEENSLWWSTTDSRKSGDYEFKLIDNFEGFLKLYPDRVYNDFSLLAVEDKLKRNDVGSAEVILANFREEKRLEQKNSIEFFRGLFFAKDEEDQKAIEIWEVMVDDIMDRYNRTRAQFALTVFLLRKEDIDLPEAIKRLNLVRSAWRGDIVEFNILKLLGEFYMDEKEYLEGFKVWRDAISAFPRSDEALLIAKKMSDKFVQIFSQGDADEIPQLEALTLYYEFRELTPIGKLGDEMIGRLVDRLMKVDLLSRSAALLTHQVRFRLVGEERDLASTKLVKIHFMNNNPQNALDVLDATSHDSMAPEVITERKYLKAKALIDLGKSNRVLALLKGDDSHQASFLRAEVYWKNKVWRKVVEELETPFRAIRREEKTLTQEETDQLLRLAVAYAIDEKKKRLSILYEDFNDFVPDESKRKILVFVATDRGPVDYRDVQYTVEFEDMEKFLEIYLESTGEKSSIFEKVADTQGSI